MFRRAYEKGAIEEALIAFEGALASGTEEEIHQFLENHPLFLDVLKYDGFLKSKFRLADAYIPDFVTVAAQRMSQRIEPVVTFIEIERANGSLFTKAGDPSSFLTHAVRQVQDWKRWVSENRTYLHTHLQKVILEEFERDQEEESDHSRRYHRERMTVGITHGFKDRYLVVAGRRQSMTVAERIRLTQMNDDLQDVRIITYDALIEDVFRALGHFEWSIQELWKEALD